VVDPVEMPALETISQHIPEGHEVVNAPTTASVFQIAIEVGQKVAAGQKLVVLDAMKTELVITAPESGIITAIHCKQGKLVSAGQQLAILRVEA